MPASCQLDQVLPRCTGGFHTSATGSGREIVNLALKKERVKAKSAELLRNLRKKKLAGLAPRSADHLDLESRITKERSLKRLFAIYESKRNSEELTPRSKVRILEKVAKAVEEGEVRSKHSNTLQSLVQDVVSGISECEEGSICKTIVALVRLNHAENDYCDTLEREILKRGWEGFSREELTEMCWAFASAEFKSEVLFKSVSKEVFSREVASFSSKSLCQLVWFFQEASHAKDFYDAIGTEILNRNMSEFESWMLAILPWAYSNVKPLNRRIFTAVEYELDARGELKSLLTKDLVMLVTAFARRQLLRRKLFRLLESALILKRDIPEAVPRELLQEFYDLMKQSPFCQAEIVKIVECALYPGVVNSIFDVLYRPRRAWKEKVIKQSLFQAY